MVLLTRLTSNAGRGVIVCGVAAAAGLVVARLWISTHPLILMGAYVLLVGLLPFVSAFLLRGRAAVVIWLAPWLQTAAVLLGVAGFWLRMGSGRGWPGIAESLAGLPWAQLSPLFGLAVGGMLAGATGMYFARRPRRWWWMLAGLALSYAWVGAGLWVERRTAHLRETISVMDLPPLSAFSTPRAALGALVKDPLPWVRSHAVEVIAEDASGLGPLLLPLALNDSEGLVRSSAVEGLERLRAPEVPQYLMKALRDPYESVRLSAISSRAWVPSPEAVAALVQVVKQGREGHYFEDMPLYALGRMRTDEAARALAGFFSHQDSGIRQSAAEALTDAPYPDDVRDGLLSLLRDAHLRVRGRAALALRGRLTTPEVVHAVARLLDDEDPWVRLRAVATLATAPGRRARAALGRSLADPHPCVSARAALALHEGRSESLIKVFKTCALKDPDVSLRLDALRFLAEIRTRAAVEALGEVDMNPHDSVRATFAVKHLTEISTVVPQALPWLIRVLRDAPEWSVRQAAAEALGRIGRAEAVPALMEAAGDSGRSLSVQEDAVKALGKIADFRSVPLLATLSRTYGLVGVSSRIALLRVVARRVEGGGERGSSAAVR